ncbi:SAM-dependent methyltransferase [Actinoalloteichus caeruleus]|uniref:SAM-dependent methyltransferase n=2 Tax=Actinoalloteichus cyanogriseus TaxID=2893586 RepID=UPI0006905BF0|nr:cobalt-precorrin-4/precorrin-4 C(11)-methyltransferase [Actinoalloteichus caeruleus]
MTSGRVSFVGAGPGAADLLTVRGARRLAEADVVLWAPAQVTQDCLREHANAEADLVDLSRTSAEGVNQIYRQAAAGRQRVVRLCPGDPALWGGIREQHETCRRFGLTVEIIPGVSTVSSAVAEVGRELTTSDGGQAVLLTTADGRSDGVPDTAELIGVAERGGTVGVLLAGARAGRLAERLLEAGFREDTPALVGYKPTWPDGFVVPTTVAGLEATVKERRLWQQTLFLVGDALATSTTRAGGAAGYRATRSGTSSSADGGEHRRRWNERSRARNGSERWQPRAAGHDDGAAGTATTNGQDSSAQDASGWRRSGDQAEQSRRPGGPTAEVAWWAVRDWQESARAPGPRQPRSARPRPDAAHPDLFATDTTTAPEPPPADPPAERPGAGDQAAQTAESTPAPAGAVPDTSGPGERSEPEHTVEQPRSAGRSQRQRPTPTTAGEPATTERGGGGRGRAARSAPSAATRKTTNRGSTRGRRADASD